MAIVKMEHDFYAEQPVRGNIIIVEVVLDCFHLRLSIGLPVMNARSIPRSLGLEGAEI